MKLGISFSPAGLLTPYHLGASYELQRLGLLRPSTALSGASGGALAAAMSALGIDQKEALQACEYVAERCRSQGTRSTLRIALDEVLIDLIPKNSAEILNHRKAACSIAYTELFPKVAAHIATKYTSQEDLIGMSNSKPFHCALHI
jgi:predicted acylesterase/phospholipase RssA